MDINVSAGRRGARHSIAVACLALVCSTLPGVRLEAQQPGWSGSAQGSGNALFGAAHTRLFASTLELGRADSTLQVRSGFQLSYGDDRTEENDRRVTARSMKGSLGLDLTPFARYSPFWFGSMESSLQQRVARRFDSGLGGKVTFVKTDATAVDVSLAVLVERTVPLAVDTLPVSPTTRARWSLRLRTRRHLTSTLSIHHVTFYQPAIERPGAYTVDTLTELEDRLWAGVSLTASLHDLVDSDARRRGATSNHDGQLLFGLRTTF
jgi:hypothetical protein